MVLVFYSLRLILAIGMTLHRWLCFAARIIPTSATPAIEPVPNAASKKSHSGCVAIKSTMPTDRLVARVRVKCCNRFKTEPDNVERNSHSDNPESPH